MVDDQTAALIALAHLQTRATQTLMASYASGSIDYGRIGDYLPIGRQLLADMETYERRWPGNVQLHTDAGPLVQQLSMYADWLDSAGERQAAAGLRREADEVARRHLTGEQESGHLRTRATEAAAAGRFQDALVGLEQAQQGFVTEGRLIDAAQTLAQLANVYEWLGDYDRALSTMDAAQGLVAERLAGGPPTRLAVDASIGRQLMGVPRHGAGQQREGEDALSLRRLHYELVQGRARASRRLGRFDDARVLFEEARPFVEEFVPAGVDFHVAGIAIETGDLDAAEPILRRIAPQFNEGLLRPRRGALRQLQSDLALGRGDAAGALARADEGLAEQATYPDLELAWKLQWRRGRALARGGRSVEALAAYREAARLADTVRLAPLGYELDTTFVADKAPMVEEAIDLAVFMGDGVAAAELIELIKARALAAVLSRPAQAVAGDDPDAARFDQLSQELDALSFQIYAGSASTNEVRRRAALLLERRTVLERIRIRDPRWRGLTVPPAVDVESTCRRLGETGRVALVLHMRGTGLVAVLLTGDGAVVGEKSMNDSVVSALQVYAENLTRVQPDHFLADLSGECDVDLRHILPGPVADALLQQRGKLLVVPHGILHLLPWATMTLDAKRLYTTRAVGVLPNLAAMSQTDESFPPARRVGLLGDPDYAGLTRYRPLPQAGAEITDIESLYGPDGLVAPVARKRDARQDVLARLLPIGGAASVLHVVCHADAAADEPLSSGLILTASTLDAGEILRLGCGFPEVVLSACSTGWRPQTPHGLALAGDDALGLVASFLEAGARSLLVSITQAKDDVAHRFMVSWHSHRRAGASPLEALRRAQLQLDEEEEPVWAWAGITAYGSV
jgi:CHAT domain-containing protein